MEMNVADIKVGSRFRKKFHQIEDLAKSIEEFGLIEPIVIDENNHLIAGERRLRAHMYLKKHTIEVKYMKDLDNLRKKEIEIEENIQRENFTWQEEVEAKAEVHKLKQTIHGHAIKGHGDGWGIKDTAESLGESLGTISMDIQLANALKIFPELKNETKKTQAFRRFKQLQERALSDELTRRMKEKGVINTPNVICGDCVVEMGKMESESIDLIVTSPPYGIDIGNCYTWGQKTMTNLYADDEFNIMDLLDKAIKEMYRILKNNTHMYMFFVAFNYTEIRRLLEKNGFDVYPTPIIWDKGSGSYPSLSKTFTSSYDAFFHCSKGKRILNGTPKDIISIKRVPPQNKCHPLQMPTELFRTLIELSTLPGEVVLDPFVGSGAALIAAKETSRIGIGIDMNHLYCENIINQLQSSD